MTPVRKPWIGPQRWQLASLQCPGVLPPAGPPSRGRPSPQAGPAKSMVSPRHLRPSAPGTPGGGRLR
eukprot:10739409-Alexandrium_andersonii.AAC.1